MRTSRIAQDTARLLEQLAHSPPRTRAQTRSALTASSSASASGSSAPRRGARRNGAPVAEKAEEDAAASAASSTSSADIEDVPFAPSSRKRKRTFPGEDGTGKSLTPSRMKRGKASALQNGAETAVSAEVDTKDNVSPTSPGFPAKPRAQPATETTDSRGKVMIHAPTLWEAQWAACQRMRAAQMAPVDTMGCDRLSDPQASARDQRYQTLVALMLSPQTKDQVTAAAMSRLRTTLADRGGFNLLSIIAMNPTELDALINPVGFHNTKTANIQRAAQILVDRHASDVPQSVNDLMALPGVGPKIAHLCLQAAWGITLGIGVDVHVHRISNRWGWHKTANPEATRMALEKWLPKDKWGPVNHMLVGFGQTVCKPVNPDCGSCELAEQGLCPSAVLPKGKKARSVLAGVNERMNGAGSVKGEAEVVVKSEEKYH